MISQFQFLISCEHASPAIPEPWKPWLAPFCESCDDHQIWDPGTSEIATHLGHFLHAPVFKGEYTRLLVDLNRSARHPSLFSPPMLELEDARRTRVLTSYYYPFRHQVIRALEYFITQGKPIIHLSIHSFTPILNGERRMADFGLLYNPQRRWERQVADLCLYYAKTARPSLTCRSNYPYSGVSDGHVTALRLPFTRFNYLGLELEFNQKLPLVDQAEDYARWIYKALRRTCNHKQVTALASATNR
jgi:predicted N-formylglutamate amidohydrolase